MKKRHIFAKICELLDTPDIIILNGARQVGKSTLLKMIQKKLIDDRKIQPSQIHIYDLEKIEDLSLWSNQTVILALPFFQAKEKQYVFIDEFQLSATIGSTLKVIHDHYPHIKCIITGSSTWYTSIDESMAGRKIVLPIWPLSFAEFLEWGGDKKLFEQYRLGLQQPITLTPPILEKINLELIKFMTYGGYPGVVEAAEPNRKIEILQELINSYLLRDIQLWHYAADPLQVKKILTILAGTIGGLLNVQTMCAAVGLSRAVAANRLDLLQNTFIINLLRPFFTNKISELVKNPKVYVVDTGLANSLLGNFHLTPQTDLFGKLAENFVVTDVHKKITPDNQLFFWRTKQKQEVDIIIKKNDRLIPIEIKSGNRTDIPASLRSFITRYKPAEAYVLNWSHVGEVTFESCRVYFRPLWCYNLL